MLLPIVMRLGLASRLRTNRLPLHICSAAASMPAACSCGSSACRSPRSPSITALGFTGPIFVTIGAALFLGEDVRLRRWIAVLVGFAGAMIIIRPGFGDLGLGAICILISTPIFSASNLISKALARTDGPTRS